jgi:hypothetical protein
MLAFHRLMDMLPTNSRSASFGIAHTFPFHTNDGARLHPNVSAAIFLQSTLIILKDMVKVKMQENIILDFEDQLIHESLKLTLERE